MKMKLLIISETVMDGVGKHIADLITNLDKTKFEIYVIHSTKRIDTHFRRVKSLLNKEVKFYQIIELGRKIDFIKEIKSYIKIKKIIKSINPDIIHCHSSKAGVLGRLVAKSLKIKKCYYTPHAYAAQNNKIGNKKKKLYIAIERFLALYFTTKTINVSFGEKKFAIDNKIDKEEKLIVIYNSIDENYDVINTCDVIKNNLCIKKNDIVVGCVARVYQQKNPFCFVNIAKEVIKKHHNVIFLWIGDGEQKENVKKYIEENGLKGKVRFIGFKKNVADYLNIFDIYLSTSLYEGLPYTLIEAIRSKVPLVASDVIGNNEVVKDEFNGYLYPLDDIDNAVRYISLLIEDKEKRNQFGENAYTLFLKEFTINKMIKAHEELYLS